MLFSIFVTTVKYAQDTGNGILHGTGIFSIILGMRVSGPPPPTPLFGFAKPLYHVPPPPPAFSIDLPALLHILLDTNDFVLKLFFYTLKFNMISTGTAKFFYRISLSPQNFSHPPDHPVFFFSFLFINFIWDLLPMNPMLSVYRSS